MWRKKGGGFLGNSIKAVWKTTSETPLCISRSHGPFFDRSWLRRALRGPIAPYNSSKVEQVILKFWIHSFSVKSLLLSPRNPPYVPVRVWGACLSSNSSHNMPSMSNNGSERSCCCNGNKPDKIYNIHRQASWNDSKRQEKTHFVAWHHSASLGGNAVICVFENIIIALRGSAMETRVL